MRDESIGFIGSRVQGPAPTRATRALYQSAVEQLALFALIAEHSYIRQKLQGSWPTASFRGSRVRVMCDA
jgi:hypothetical protein